MAIHVLSLDFDGCLFNAKYLINKNVIESNAKLFKLLKKENDSYEETIIFVGSNRQSHELDIYNSFKNDTDSCFEVIVEIARELSAKLDKFLLADVYNDLTAGTAFQLATSENSLDIEHPNCRFDETKLSLLYAQIHKIASDYSHEKIVFNFFDDRQDILKALFNFFQKFPEMIPKNVNLYLNQYKGAEVQLYPNAFEGEIRGKGIIDENYSETVKKMADLAKTPYFAEYVTPDLLQNLKEKNLIVHNKEINSKDEFSFFSTKHSQKSSLITEFINVQLNDEMNKDEVKKEETIELNSSISSESDKKTEDIDLLVEDLEDLKRFFKSFQ